MPAPSDQPTFKAPRGRPTSVPGHLVVKLAPGAVRPHLAARRAGAAARARALPDTVMQPLEYLRQNAGLKTLEPMFDEPPAMRRARTTARGGDALRLAVAASVDPTESEISGLNVATLAEDAVSASVIKAVESSPAVEYVETLPVRWASRVAADPMMNLQWGLRAIRWFDAQPTTADVTVGIMDTGIDRRHPDLAGVDVVYEHFGFSANDIVGHGTHVAGIVAAAANNAVGIAGVASCRLVMWKIFSDTPDGGEYYVDTPAYYSALQAAANAGISSLNLSIGGFQRARTEDLLLQRLIRRGVTVCAAMGNEFQDGNPTEYPAAFSGVVSVGALAEDRRRSAFSNTGKHIDLVAPGSHILSTLPTKRSDFRDEVKYASWSGTSMATPHVAAAAALVAARHPELGPSEIAARLRDTAAKLPGMRSSAFTKEYGNGLLDLAAALA